MKVTSYKIIFKRNGKRRTTFAEFAEHKKAKECIVCLFSVMHGHGVPVTAKAFLTALKDSGIPETTNETSDLYGTFGTGDNYTDVYLKPVETI